MYIEGKNWVWDVLIGCVYIYISAGNLCVLLCEWVLWVIDKSIYIYMALRCACVYKRVVVYVCVSYFNMYINIYILVGANG